MAATAGSSRSSQLQPLLAGFFLPPPLPGSCAYASARSERTPAAAPTAADRALEYEARRLAKTAAELAAEVVGACEPVCGPSCAVAGAARNVAGSAARLAEDEALPPQRREARQRLLRQLDRERQT
jgi:hypothetical protein